MPRLVWLTDLHLDFIDADEDIEAFCRRTSARADGLLISGDIGNAATIDHHLHLIDQSVRCPVYFVLGNHDFYGGAIAEVRGRVAERCRASDRLRWLPQAGVVELSDDTALVGHDGWADGRLGLGVQSDFLLNDYFCIRDFQDRTHRGWFEAIAALGDEAAAYFREILPRAFERRTRVIVLTHVPPFREASWHQGRLSDDEALPHFACKAVGDVLAAAMRERPDCTMTVYCGHTHSPGVARILPNLEVHTGRAQYGVLQAQPEAVVI